MTQIYSLFNDGGALDSQTTESQYIHELVSSKVCSLPHRATKRKYRPSSPVKTEPVVTLIMSSPTIQPASPGESVPRLPSRSIHEVLFDLDLARERVRVLEEELILLCAGTVGVAKGASEA